MKIKKIGNITLTSTLWWEEYNSTSQIQSEVEQTINGGVIVWEQPYQISSQNITLSGDTDGWQTDGVKNQIKALSDASIGLNTTITTIEDEVINVRFRHEVGVACEFERVVGAYECDYFKCKISLAKV